MITWNLKLVKKLWWIFFSFLSNPFTTCTPSVPQLGLKVVPGTGSAIEPLFAALRCTFFCEGPDLQNQPCSLAERKHCNYRNTSHSKIKQKNPKKGAAPHSSGQNSLCPPRRPFSAAGRVSQPLKQLLQIHPLFLLKATKTRATLDKDQSQGSLSSCLWVCLGFLINLLRIKHPN